MDRREEILARPLVVMQGVPGVETAARNRLDPHERRLPQIVILDADEAADDADNRTGRPRGKPRRVAMTPEIYIAAMAAPEEIGALLNALRAAVIKAVLADEPLAALCVDGDIVYEGCGTALGLGRSMAGEMGLSFTFTYLLEPGRL